MASIMGVVVYEGSAVFIIDAPTMFDHPDGHGSTCLTYNRFKDGRQRMIQGPLNLDDRAQHPADGTQNLIVKIPFEHLWISWNKVLPGLTRAISLKPWMVETRSGKMQDPAQERIKVEESAKPQPGATICRDASSDPVVLNPNIDILKYDGTEDPRP
ncbi:hypothetical protein LAZ67_22001141 [Cordylochernes scorpioides]|uniref:Uncharacterized protein n=1 Tax=Cordylochernes scorpioides TaxID=51811 RepID=A0ABY6LP27_9ARAC|nr:hypothetical protein LAZ67_22001141 [Cordylochernes scorpioides]